MLFITIESPPGFFPETILNGTRGEENGFSSVLVIGLLEQVSNMEGLVSIIVPIYAIDRYLGICIESIINQTYKNIEIILVDDGSKDRCAELCDLYAKKDERIRVIHKPNGGLVSARKAGLRQSNGQYITYVDGDDWIAPNFVEKLYNAALSCDADVVCAGFTRVLFTKSKQFLNDYPLGVYEGELLHALWGSMICSENFYRPAITTYVWNKLFIRDILLEPQLLVDDRISIGEDAAVTYPALYNSSRVIVIDNTDYHYRQREDSMLKQSTSYADEAQKLLYLYNYMGNWAKKTNPIHHVIHQVEDYLFATVIMRSGGRLIDDSYSTFDSKYFGKKVVIFSAGTFGQQLMKRFEETEHCTVVGWVDDDYWEYRRCCLDVDPIESIKELDFDYVLIAKADQYLADEIQARIMDFGVNPEKILTVTVPAEKKQLLDRFLDVEALRLAEASRKRGNSSHA